MKTFIRFVIVFLALTGAAALATGLLDVQFGRADYWDRHGFIFLACAAFFPRLTLLFGGVDWGGPLWWLGWLFAPRLLVAVLATFAYWHANPFLVIAAWLVALSGESSEKYVVVERSRGGRSRRSRGGGPSDPAGSGGGQGFDRAKWVKAD